MKKRKPQKPLRQTTLDEFSGGDMLVGADTPGATIKLDPQQGNLFREEARQLHFEIENAPKRKHRFFTILFVFVLALIPIQSIAHPGDVDARGGHWNQANGEYHYHHGWPAHHHLNGRCPYNFTQGPNVSGSSNEGMSDYQRLYAETTTNSPIKKFNYTGIPGGFLPGLLFALWISTRFEDDKGKTTPFGEKASVAGFFIVWVLIILFVGLAFPQ